MKPDNIRKTSLLYPMLYLMKVYELYLNYSFSVRHIYLASVAMIHGLAKQSSTLIIAAKMSPSLILYLYSINLCLPSTLYHISPNIRVCQQTWNSVQTRQNGVWVKWHPPPAPQTATHNTHLTPHTTSLAHHGESISCLSAKASMPNWPAWPQ